jgi:hypothetical protein
MLTMLNLEKQQSHPLAGLSTQLDDEGREDVFCFPVRIKYLLAE